jgi:hypothetical protein
MRRPEYSTYRSGLQGDQRLSAKKKKIFNLFLKEKKIGKPATVRTVTAESVRNIRIKSTNRPHYEAVHRFLSTA